MDNFENVKNGCEKITQEIKELLEEISTAVVDIKDYSTLLNFQIRLRELNTNLDSQSDKARRVREKGGPASVYHQLVKNIKEDRLHIVGAMNQIADYIELELKKRDNECIYKVERSINKPLLEFPDFEGENLLYLKFKKEFLFVMGHVHLKDEIKKYHLINSIKIESLANLAHHHTYDEIWGILDNRYGHKCSLAICCLNDFFSVQKPKDEVNEIEHYWDTVINKLRNILALEISTEKFLVHYIICSLPQTFKEDIFRRLRNKESNNMMFNIDEVTNIFWDALYTLELASRESKHYNSCTQITDDQNDSDDGKGEFPFPEFHGDMLEYKHFKQMFMGIGNIYGMSDEIKLYHLKHSLKDDSLRYIGSWGSHHESYNNMWKYLDKRYNDLWMLSNKLVKDFFNMKQPVYEHDEIQTYWNGATGKLSVMLSLELNLENILGIWIIQSLPREFRFELVKKLQWNEHEEKLYGLDKLLESYNNIMCVQKSLTDDSTTHNLDRKGRGQRKFHGNYRGRGKGRACKQYD